MHSFKKYRPWGHLEWLLNKLPDQRWNLLGCVSTGERSLSSLENLKSLDAVETVTFVSVIDPDSYYSEQTSERIDLRKDELNLLMGEKVNVPEFNLISGVRGECS